MQRIMRNYLRSWPGIPRRPSPGLTLTETVISTFLLLIGFLVIARLFHSSLHHQARLDSATLSTLVAERALEGAQEWLRTGSNFEIAETIYNPVTFTDQGFQVEVEVAAAVPVASPCTELENNYPVGQRRQLLSSYKPIQVRATFDGQTLVLDSMVGEPPREVQAVLPVAVGASAPIPVPVPKNSSIEFSAQLIDTAGFPIPDVLFSWNVQPINGNGTLEGLTRDGYQRTFRHRMMLYDGTWGFSPGIGPGPLPSRCKVTATALYRGIEHSGDSAEIQLEP